MRIYITIFVVVLFAISCGTDLGITAHNGSIDTWQLSVSKQNWAKVSKKQVPDSDFELLHHSGKAYLIAISQDGELTEEVLEQIATDKLMGALPNAELSVKNIVALHSLNLLHVSTQGAEGDKQIVYDGWFYSGTEGTIQLIFRLDKEYFSANPDIVNEVLAGIHIKK